MNSIAMEEHIDSVSDTPFERNSNSKTNLIEVQHVGVTAKLQSPLKSFLQSSTSSTDVENLQPFQSYHQHKSKYNKFSNDNTQCDTETTTENSKLLYEMRAIRESNDKHANKAKLTPCKIEFQLYKQRPRFGRRSSCNAAQHKSKTSKRKLFSSKTRCHCHDNASEGTIMQRLRHSLENMRNARITSNKPQKPKNADKTGKAAAGGNADASQSKTQQPYTCEAPNDTRIGIYPFEHGCTDYLRTTDCHPQILSMLLAERATYYATRFWAEFFGSLHIGVTFVVTFMLQTYRFLLYSIINTLIVGFLHMTSDYLIKPILTVAFNGFLQPPLILLFNVLTSIRDLLEPVADTLNNFMRPVATVGKSLRLVHVSNNKHRKLVKDV